MSQLTQCQQSGTVPPITADGKSVENFCAIAANSSTDSAMATCCGGASKVQTFQWCYQWCYVPSQYVQLGSTAGQASFVQCLENNTAAGLFRSPVECDLPGNTNGAAVFAAPGYFRMSSGLALLCLLKWIF